MRLLKAFGLAFNMLTIIPFFKVHDFYKGINGHSAMFYPLVGFLLGSVLWATHALLEPYFPATHLSVIIFTLWVVLTGALHLDGLSDTIDGLFVSREKALEVMKDSHVGGMGMIFTLLFLLLKLSSLIHVEAYYLLPLVLMFSRLNALLAIYCYSYISSGVGELIKEEFKLTQLLIALAFSLTLGYLFSFSSLFIVAFFTLIVSAKFFSSRLGGLSGDIYGFIIELTELMLLNYILVVHFS
jgi:cobalamin 5'-phosphate synthase/cobalamin synthase